MATALHAFAGYGIELEYAIVDRGSLEPRPLAEPLLRACQSRRFVAEPGRFLLEDSADVRQKFLPHFPLGFP